MIVTPTGVHRHKRATLTVFVKYLWAFPVTALGLLVILPTLATGARIRVHKGVIEVYGGCIGFMLRRLIPLPGGASGLTLGHVVLGRTLETLDRIRGHELVHVRQVEKWGLLFLPAYLLSSVWARLRGRHYYYDNRFEREAFALDEKSRPVGDRNSIPST